MRGVYGKARALPPPPAISPRVAIGSEFWGPLPSPGIIAGEEPLPEQRVGRAVWAVASVASLAASAYHGYKRNDSVGWALWWAAMGGLFPVVTPAIALAQGFGKEKR